MLRYALALSVVSIMTVPGLAYAQVEVESAGPVVNLSITENVVLDPDMANLSAGVTTIEPTAVASMRANANAMRRVIDRIEAMGIDRDDIQTTGIELNPDYAYNQQTQQQVFRGYRVSNRVSVKVRDIESVGNVLDTLVAVGATDIGGIGWAVEDQTSAIDQARQAAFARGRDQAMEYASMAGFSGIRLLQIGENVMAGPPVQYGNQIIVTAASRSDATPVVPGQVQVGVTISLSYEFTQ